MPSAQRLVLLAVAAVTLLAAACGTSGPPGLSQPPAVVVDEEPIVRGARFISQRFDEIDPLHLSGMDYLYRNWGIEPLRDAGRRAVTSLERIRSGFAEDGTASSQEEEYLLFARLVDQSRAAPSGIDRQTSTPRVMLSALYCDERPITDEDLRSWNSDTDLGGYEATHVLLAWSWARALGCTNQAVDRAGQRAVEKVRAEFRDFVGPDPQPDAVNDLSIEQAAFLALVGDYEVLTQPWIDAVLAAQQGDGGWASDPRDASGPGTSDWHATALAIWMLSASTGPGAGADWVRR